MACILNVCVFTVCVSVFGLYLNLFQLLLYYSLLNFLIVCILNVCDFTFCVSAFGLCLSLF